MVPGAESNLYYKQLKFISFNSVISWLYQQIYQQTSAKGQGYYPNLIEHQLTQTARDPIAHAYNRTAHLLEQQKMMQDWADYLDKLKTGTEIIT